MKKLGWIAILVMMLGIVGCGSKPQGGDLLNDKAAQEKAVEVGKRKFEIFQKAGGDWDKMTPEDKKEYIGFHESEADAREYWNLQKNPPGGAPGR